MFLYCYRVWSFNISKSIVLNKQAWKSLGFLQNSLKPYWSLSYKLDNIHKKKNFFTFEISRHWHQLSRYRHRSLNEEKRHGLSRLTCFTSYFTCITFYILFHNYNCTDCKLFSKIPKIIALVARCLPVSVVLHVTQERPSSIFDDIETSLNSFILVGRCYITPNALKRND